MSAEHVLRKAVVELLRPIGAFAVENTSGVGTPDVATTLGWIELKQLAAWPARPSTNVVLDIHNGQRIWLNHWQSVGGRAWVLARVGREILVWRGPWAAQNLDRQTRDVLLRHAVGHWTQGLPHADVLVQALVDSIVRN